MLALACACAPKGEAALAADKLLSESKPRKGSLVLSCAPADASVEVDGVEQGACSDFAHGRALALGSGMHRVEVKKTGFWPYQTFIDPERTRAALEVELSASQQPKAGGAQ